MKVIAIIAGVLLMFTTGCKKKGCLESSGIKTIQTRPATSFSVIDVNDNINVILKQDTVESIRVEAGENLQSFITTDIQKNTLTLSNTSSCSWMRIGTESINVYVSVKQLNNINLYGSGSISSSNTITSPDIQIDAFESPSPVHLALQTANVGLSIRYENASYTITGSTANCVIYCGQKGIMDLRNLQINTLFMDYRSIFNAYVQVKTAMDVRVQYKGNVYYKGNPSSITYAHYNEGQLLPY
jgi:hypothetical protein